MFRSITQSYKNLPISPSLLGVIALLLCVFLIGREYASHILNEYNYPFSWFFTSTKFVVNYLIWILLAPLVYKITLRLQNRNLTLGNIFWVLIGILLLSVAHRILTSRIDDSVYYISEGYLKDFLGANSVTGLVIGGFTSSIELLVLIAIFFAVDYQKRYM
ncbi:MAG: hypothetical protein JSV59_04020, partial [Flavobacteriaceae bacterium]